MVSECTSTICRDIQKNGCINYAVTHEQSHSNPKKKKHPNILSNFRCTVTEMINKATYSLQKRWYFYTVRLIGGLPHPQISIQKCRDNDENLTEQLTKQDVTNLNDITTTPYNRLVLVLISP